MESVVKDFISHLENNIRKTNPYYDRVLETPVYYKQWQVFIFSYDMKRGGGYQMAFELRYEGDFHTKHRFDIMFYANALDFEVEHRHENGELKRYVDENKKEIRKHYIHFLRCLQETIEQHKTFRLYQLMHADFICNKIKEDGLEKLMQIHEERKASITDRLKIWLRRFVFDRRRNV